MKNILRYFFLLAVTVSAFASISCHSEETSSSKAATSKVTEITEISYTFLKDCKDTVGNDNAAFTELSCPPVGDYKVNITAQSPQYFNIYLNKGDVKLSSDFTMVSHDNPIETGKAIEWHVVNQKPRYMIFRLSWGSEAEPFKMKEYLVVNLVTNTDICVLATVDVKNNKNANIKAQNLILEKFQLTDSCPKTILTL